MYTEEEALNERLSNYAKNFERAYQGQNTVKEQLGIDPEQVGGKKHELTIVYLSYLCADI